MAKPEPLHFLAVSRLRESLDISWYKIQSYLDLAVIPRPDAYADDDRGLWLVSKLPAIQAAIHQHERSKSTARHNGDPQLIYRK